MRASSFSLLFALLTVPALASHGLAWAGACKIPKGYGCRDLGQVPEPPGDVGDLSPLRLAILAAAQRQIGQVSALDDGEGNKCGWERLTEFYNTAYDHPLRAKDYLKIKNAMEITTEEDSEGQLVAVVDEQKVNEWCGIFALWAVKTGAEKALQDESISNVVTFGLGDIASAGWRFKHQVWGIDGIPFVWGRKGLRPGDIAYFGAPSHHQAVVERIIGSKVYTIDGNQECQQISRKVSRLSSVAGYYRVD